MAKITVENTGETKEVPDGASIVAACEAMGVPFGCQDGLCGTCIIETVDGAENLSAFNDKEKDILADAAGQRLACQCKANGDVTIRY